MLRLFGVLGTRAVIAVCLIVSLSVCVGAWRNLWMASQSTTARGTVLRQIEELSADWENGTATASARLQMAQARRSFQAVVGFEVDGRTYEVVSARKGAVHLYPLGSTLTVLFLPGRPQQAWLRDEAPDVWSQAALLLMGTVVGAGAVRWWWWLAKRRPRFRRRPHPTREATAEARAPESE